jgi:hypothetical protein
MKNRIEFLLKKLKKTHQEKRIISALFSKVIPNLTGVRYLVKNPAKTLINLHSPEYVEPDKRELELVERIFQSFIKMKEAQKHINNRAFIPSSIWQEHINNDYQYLVSGWKENDIDKFHFFLSNFGSWKSYTGIENSPEIVRAKFIKKRYVENEIFYKSLKTWEWFNKGRDKKYSDLSYPIHGNQAGAYLKENFIGVGSFFNEIYGSILSGIISDREHPVVADLGGGYGKLAYFTLRKINKFTLINFDLPEVLCVEAYYLMKTWPEKKVLLYGEKEYLGDIHQEYDLIFMPNFEIPKVGHSTIDLFINKNSMGEMTKESVTEYLKYICSSSHYFFHMNHEFVRRLDNNSLLASEYPIPNSLKLILRYPDMGHLLSKGKVDFKMDIFMYLYENLLFKGIEKAQQKDSHLIGKTL